jgi:TRAP-type mannitol/chloroaromatic compound transport system permease small subunit
VAGVKSLETVLKCVDDANEWIGRVMAAAVMIIFVVVLAEVVLRYFFNSPTIWGSELPQLIFGTYVILSGGPIMRHGGHVNVDIFYSRFPPRTKALLDIATFALFFLFCGMLLVYGGQLALESMGTWERSQSAWNPPLYPFKLMIPIGALLLLLQGTAKLVRDIAILFSGETRTTAADGGKETL